MLRREAISLLLGAGIVRGNQPASLLLDVRSKRVLAAHNLSETVAPPGSTLKPFVLSGLLKRGKLGVREAWPCPGRLTIAGRQFTCSHPTLSTPMDAGTALAYSCNCFVAHMAERYRSGELAQELHGAGFAQHVAPASTPDATRLQALGEEGVQVTVAELAHAYRGLALSAGAAVRDGLEGAVEYGTAQLARVPGVKVAGKTGSAQTVDGARIAWFAGFLPSRDPEVAVAVMLQGRSGGSDAAPVAGRLLQAYREGKL